MPLAPYRFCAALALAVSAALPTAAEDESLRGTFLVADPQLAGSPFEHAVVLLIEHGPEGAHGLVVNRPTEATLADALPGQTADIETDYPLHLGGPVLIQQLTLLVRTDTTERGMMQVLPNVAYAAAESAFDAILAASPPPESVRVFAGYTGWAPGQLEREIERGDWHILPAQTAQIFTEAPEDLWQELYDQVEGGGPEGEPLQSI